MKGKRRRQAGRGSGSFSVPSSGFRSLLCPVLSEHTGLGPRRAEDLGCLDWQKEEELPQSRGGGGWNQAGWRQDSRGQLSLCLACFTSPLPFLLSCLLAS